MTSPNLVVTRQTVQTRRLIRLSVLAAIMLVALVAYEVGQNKAGYSRIESLENLAELEAELKDLKDANKKLSAQIAVLETSAKIDREAYRTVENELIGLQSRILEQEEDIEFYKGIVNENDGTGLRIQDFSVTQGLGEREFDLRLVLAQAFRSTRLVSGQVEMVIEGLQEGQPARLGLTELVPEADTSRIAYSFRYFQDLKAEIVIPDGFEPERVHVIVRVKGKNSKTVEDFFVWEVKSG